ncbi:hypothetical protein ACFSC4_10955 [Deinococcus malanensis]|uniref:hypothetical protein n=1 Tax=Deinococcus malanensis TaxID=1706855 RepID=UPI0036352F5C
MILKRLPALTALTATALLMASCDPQRNGTQPPTAADPAATAPATPVAGQSTEAAALPAAATAAATVLQTMLDPRSTDFDPDLRALLALFPSSGMQSLGQSAQTVTRPLLGAFGLATPGSCRRRPPRQS